MNPRRVGTGALVASPVLVGAVTALITLIAVFIAFNANKGLPFVPTYDLKAELPSGGKLVNGNEIRMGGFRVGVIQNIKPKAKRIAGKNRGIALVQLKLDKTVEPLGRDTRLRTRPRSALGLKYLELSRGRAREKFTPGDTIPLKNASEPREFEDVYDLFDRRTRPRVQQATEGFGDAFAGRGPSLNRAIASLNPLFRSLTPVMRNLSDPDTELDQFFLQIGRASAQVAPVARTQAVLFTNMADTFAAIGRDPRALQATIEKSPPTMDAAISSFRVQRPFLADFADLSRRLRPAARQLPRSLPALNRALRVGTPVLPRTVALNRRLEGAFDALDELFENPSTLLTLRDLRTTLAVARPALEFIAPYQTVCSYANYFVHVLGEHMSTIAPDNSGTAQNQGAKEVNSSQPNSYSTIEGSRRVDVPPRLAGKGRGAESNGDYGPPGTDLHRKVNPEYPPAIDAQGNADCQRGQEGAPNGPTEIGGRYGAGFVPGTNIPNGGNSPVTIDNYPILSGGTFKSRELGIDNLRELP